MKIILSAEAMTSPLAGIGHYTFELANGLKHHPAIEQLYVYAYGKVTNEPAALRDQKANQYIRRFKTIPFANQVRKFYQYFDRYLLSYRAKTLKADLYHAPNIILRNIDLPKVATIHDFSFVHYPEFHPTHRSNYLNKEIIKTVAMADHLITDSEFVKKELITLFSVNPNKITSIPLGVRQTFKLKTEAEIQPTLQKYNLKTKSYILAVSTVEPRKNFAKLFEAYANLPSQLQKKFPLVLVGSSGWLSEELHEKISRFERAGLIKYVGYISETELSNLYAGARGFVYPSLYEGFGFPIVEAMASGTPVLTSNCSAMPEISGDAALLIDPYNVDAITQGLIKIMQDDEFCRVASEKGLKVAAQYNWKQCVDKTVAVYQMVLKI